MKLCEDVTTEKRNAYTPRKDRMEGRLSRRQVVLGIEDVEGLVTVYAVSIYIWRGRECLEAGLDSINGRHSCYS